jgi:hypothetical protein
MDVEKTIQQLFKNVLENNTHIFKTGMTMPDGSTTFGVTASSQPNYDYPAYYYGAFPNMIFNSIWRNVGLGVRKNQNGIVHANNILYSDKRYKTAFYIEEYKQYYFSDRIDYVDGWYSNQIFACSVNGVKTDIRTLDELMDYLNHYLH